jgi:hypothetical protein
MSATAIGVLVAIVLAFLAGWHFGRQGLELKDANQVVKQEVAQDQKRERDQTTIAQEGKAYADATDPLAPLPAPVVRLCYSAPAPPPRPARPAPDAPVASGKPDPVPLQAGPDVGPALVRVGHDADAQIAGLQDYITKVCRATH